MKRQFKYYSLLLTLSALLLSAVEAEGQTRPRASRIGIVNPSSPDHTTYVEFYEFEQVEVQPAFPGGERGLVNYVNNTREYPYNEYMARRQGRVLCSFIILTDGQVAHVKVLRSSGYEALDNEAVRVIKKMPRWEAGRIWDTKVNVRCILPIAFRL
ncbi:MAG: energy transducer TonB [Muribaculaceae bacterium]|nr:energy transducer TonB [Muribaculaceae bacterium]